MNATARIFIVSVTCFGTLLFVVAGCGGGGTITPSTTPTPASTPIPNPNAGKILFYSNPNTSNDFSFVTYSINGDGTNQIRLTKAGESDLYPSFSPDGTKIVFSSYRSGSNDIYLMNADGTNQTRLTNNGLSNWYPRFSPDGTKITFSAYRDGNDSANDIYATVTYISPI
jgi:Tol biopolymer transport system component